VNPHRELEHLLNRLERIHRDIMADTTALTAAVANLDTAVTAAVAELATANDQPAVDAATTAIAAATAQLNAAVTPAAPAAS
jgi:hypothetical protein